MTKRDQKLRDASDLLSLVEHLFAAGQTGSFPWSGVRVAIGQARALMDNALDQPEGAAPPPWRHQAYPEQKEPREREQREQRENNVERRPPPPKQPKPEADPRIVEHISNPVLEGETKGQVRELVDDANYSGTFNRIQLTELRGQ